MMNILTLLKVTKTFARAELCYHHRHLTKLKLWRQNIQICKLSLAAHDQRTQIRRGGTGATHLYSRSRPSSLFGDIQRNVHCLRHCHLPKIRYFCTSRLRNKKEEITVNFLNRDGETITVKAKVGDTLLDTVIDNDVDIDGFGACEGTLACSTCHLIFDEDIYETLPEKLDEEEDMLDLAYGLTDTSRLGCQITLTKEMDNLVVGVPEGISDARDV